MNVTFYAWVQPEVRKWHISTKRGHCKKEKCVLVINSTCKIFKICMSFSSVN